jgi:hypothetical protein
MNVEITKPKFVFKPYTLTVSVESKEEEDALLEFCGYDITHTDVAVEYGELDVQYVGVIRCFLSSIHEAIFKGNK